MRKTKTAVCILLSAVLTVSLSGCSFLESITGGGTIEESSSSDTSQSEGSTVTADSGRVVDDQIGVPTFNEELPVTVLVAQGSTYELDGTAASPDGGDVTYQWYVNNVASNGGGTAIEGADEAIYIADTSEVGIKYYYVVASNNHDDSYNMTVGAVSEVNVIQSGEWTTDEFGGTRYLAADGSYPSGVWVLIGTDSYAFDENGYRLTGWIANGDGTYTYFDEEGRYRSDVVMPEGGYIDENGNLVDPAVQAQEAAPAEAAAPEAAQ